MEVKRRLKELIVRNNTLIFQMISARDKQSGLYLPMQDGNVNSMLHRIYNNLESIDRVYMTLPKKELIDGNQMLQLESINHNFFKSSIVFIHSDFYGSSVSLTREQAKESEFLNIVKSINATYIINEFPVFLHRMVNSDVQYNFNWNKVSDDDVSPSALGFNEELKISKYFDVFLFSDIQYDYMTSKTSSTKIYRSSQIFNRDYVRLISELYMTDHYDDETANIIDEISMCKAKINFFTSRIDDTRYEFRKISEDSFKNSHNEILVAANHLNVNIDDFVNHIEDFNMLAIIDYAKIIDMKHNRFAYFYTLSKLREYDEIHRYEKDMHISLIEQYILTNAKIIAPNFITETIESYIQ